VYVYYLVLFTSFLSWHAVRALVPMNQNRVLLNVGRRQEYPFPVPVTGNKFLSKGNPWQSGYHPGDLTGHCACAPQLNELYIIGRRRTAHQSEFDTNNVVQQMTRQYLNVRKIADWCESTVQHRLREIADSFEFFNATNSNSGRISSYFVLLTSIVLAYILYKCELLHGSVNPGWVSRQTITLSSFAGNT